MGFPVCPLVHLTSRESPGSGADGKPLGVSPTCHVPDRGVLSLVAFDLPLGHTGLPGEPEPAEEAAVCGWSHMSFPAPVRGLHERCHEVAQAGIPEIRHPTQQTSAPRSQCTTAGVPPATA